SQAFLVSRGLIRAQTRELRQKTSPHAPKQHQRIRKTPSNLHRFSESPVRRDPDPCSPPSDRARARAAENQCAPPRKPAQRLRVEGAVSAEARRRITIVDAARTAGPSSCRRKATQKSRSGFRLCSSQLLRRLRLESFSRRRSSDH